MEHNKILTMTMAFHITMAFHTREFPQPRSALFFTEDVIQHPTLCTLMSFNMIGESANLALITLGREGRQKLPGIRKNP